VESILDRITSDSQWLPIAMLVAAALAFRTLARARGRSVGETGLAALGHFHGAMILVMAIGHLVAITILAGRGELVGSAWILYPIGLLVGAPAIYLLHQSSRALDSARYDARRLTAANLWLGITLLVMGLHNIPLALPALVTLAYQRIDRPIPRRALASVAVAGYVALFAGALVFMASGQSFEEFTGMESGE